MAYNTDELERDALHEIRTKNLVFVSDVIALLPCSRQTFYDHELDKLDTIKKALSQNKINKKIKLRERFENSESPALLIAAYKLIATDDERKALANKTEIDSKVDVTTGGKRLTFKETQLER